MYTWYGKVQINTPFVHSCILIRVTITLLRSITMLCDIDNIPQNIPWYFPYSKWMREISKIVGWILSLSQNIFMDMNYVMMKGAPPRLLLISLNFWIYYYYLFLIKFRCMCFVWVCWQKQYFIRAYLTFIQQASWNNTTLCGNEIKGESLYFLQSNSHIIGW